MTRSWWHYWRSIGHVPKKRVESYRSIDCCTLYDNRKYPFQEGEENFDHGCRIQLFPNQARFTLPGSGEYRYQVPVVQTSCNYGGSRHWFLCPLPKCQRRCKKLYLCREGVFVCRKCLNLAYTTQNRCRLDRIIDKKWKLIRQLGADSDIFIQKPKHMHQKTFERLQQQISSLDHQAHVGIFEKFGCPL